MISVTELFARRYDELVDGLKAGDSFEIVNVAATLRQLLMDSSPLIHQANRELSLKIRFKVNKVSDINDYPDQPSYLYDDIDPSDLISAHGVLELKLDRFLQQKIIQTPDTAVTVRDVIAHAANKAGGVHFDVSRTSVDDVIAGAVPLAIRSITRIVVAALKPLRDALAKIPDSIPLFAHYRLKRGSLIRCSGQGQFLETNLTHELRHGFSWNGVIRVMTQAESGDRTLYELGNLDGTPPRISLIVNIEGDLIAEAQVGEETVMQVRAGNFSRSPFFNRFSYIGLQLCYSENGASLELYLNNIRVAFQVIDAVVSSRQVTRQTIGAKLSGLDSATFEIRELVLSDWCLSDEQRQQLARYFWMQWHN
jgi:hypothetical protein